MTDPKEIKKMHQAKLKSFSDRELGMQIGACLNKAVDIAIHNAVIGKQVVDPRIIKEWTDILFKIGTAKKNEINAGTI